MSLSLSIIVSPRYARQGILVCIFVCWAWMLLAQTAPPNLAYVGQVVVADYANPLHYPGVYLLGDHVSLRSCPDMNCEVLALVSVGTHLILLERSNNALVLGGISSHWFRTEVNGKVGWIWGGMIAKSVSGSHKDVSVKFLAGPESLKWTDGQWRLTWEVRAIQSGIQLDKISVSIPAAGYPLMLNCESMGLEQVDDILYLSGEWSANNQRFATGSILVWANSSFAQMIELPALDEAPYAERKELFFPVSMEGKPGRVILVSHRFAIDNLIDAADQVEMVTTRTYYRWDGARLTPSGEPDVVSTHLFPKNHR